MAVLEPSFSAGDRASRLVSGMCVCVMESYGRLRGALDLLFTTCTSLVSMKPEEVLGKMGSVPDARAAASFWERRSLDRRRNSSCIGAGWVRTIYSHDICHIGIKKTECATARTSLRVTSGVGGETFMCCAEGCTRGGDGVDGRPIEVYEDGWMENAKGIWKLGRWVDCCHEYGKRL